jgi:hypothetical protein
VYNLNYTPTLGVQSWREIRSGGTRTKGVEYRCPSWLRRHFQLVLHSILSQLWRHMRRLRTACATRTAEHYDCVLWQKQWNKWSEPSNYSTLSRRLESTCSAMKPLARLLCKFLTAYVINCIVIITANIQCLILWPLSYLLFFLKKVAQVRGNENFRPLVILERTERMKRVIIWQIIFEW